METLTVGSLGMFILMYRVVALTVGSLGMLILMYRVVGDGDTYCRLSRYVNTE